MPALRRYIRSFILVCAAAAVFGCERGNPGEREFDALAKDFIAFYLETNPTIATSIGAHRYDDRLEDMSAEAVASYIGTCRRYADRLRALDLGSRSRDRAIDAWFLLQNIELIVADLGEESSYTRNPQMYTEILAGSIYGILSQQASPLEERLDRVANRLDGFPRLVEQGELLLGPG